MTDKQLTLTRFYRGWEAGNANVVKSLRSLTNDQLQLRPAPGQWAIWQLAAHTAGARAYWFGHLGESEEELAPLLGDPQTGMGWEDVEDHPRSADELAWAFETTWKMIEDRLGCWTPDILDDRFSRELGSWAGPLAGQRQGFSRQDVIWRLIAHDGQHSGEISLILGMHGLPPVEFWSNFAGWA
jgi:uncharacterized damage-inducible protein DinB